MHVIFTDLLRKEFHFFLEAQFRAVSRLWTTQLPLLLLQQHSGSRISAQIFSLVKVFVYFILPVNFLSPNNRWRVTCGDGT